MVTDSISAAIAMLEGEIDEINRAVVRLAERKDQLSAAVGVLQTRHPTAVAATPLPGTAAPVATKKGRKPRRQPVPLVEAMERLHRHFEAAPAVWHTTHSLTIDTQLDSAQVSNALAMMRVKGDVERVDADQEVIEDSRARFMFRLTQQGREA